MTGVPDVVLNAPRNIREAQTKIHKHPHRDEIVQVLTLYCLEPAKRGAAGKLPVTELANELNKEWPDLQVDAEFLRRFMAKFIIPLIVVTPEWVKAGIIQAGHDLNLVERKLKAARELEEYLEANKDKMKPAEYASALRSLTAMYGDIEDSLERFNVVPGRKTESVKTEFKVDLAGMMDKMSKGRPPANPGDPRIRN